MVNIQGYILCRQTKVTSRCRVMGAIAAKPPARLGMWCNLTSDSGRYIVTEKTRSVWAGTRGAPCLFGAWGSPCRCAQLCSVPRSQTQTLQYHVRGLKCLAAGGWQVWCLSDQPFRFHHGLLLLPIYEAKYTTLNPIQLPTTPSAEYALVNINGRNS